MRGEIVRTMPESRGEYAIRAARDPADPHPHGLDAMAIAGEVCFVYRLFHREGEALIT